MKREHLYLFLFLAVIFASCVTPQGGPEHSWVALSDWQTVTDGKSSFDMEAFSEDGEDGLLFTYKVKRAGWVSIGHRVTEAFSEEIPIVFDIRAEGTGNLEVKFVDQDGSNFLKKIPLKKNFQDWTTVVLYRDTLEYGWGGNKNFDGLQDFYLAFSGESGGKGKVWIRNIGIGEAGLEATYDPGGATFDPNRELPGFGFKERRHETQIPEDPLVFEWIKAMQDHGSPDGWLLPSMEGSIAQTFNNSLSAIVFILKGEQERAERILDFYAKATVRENEDPTLQNFFYKGEARGFFQSILLKGDPAKRYHSIPNDDRWVGDMAWLLIAYKYYEKEYGDERYQEIIQLLKDLLISYYHPAEVGGYILDGWRKGDSRLHENYGHGELNVDCYAVFRLCGEMEMAEKIKKWILWDFEGRNNLPLDLYTWRVLAMDEAGLEVLNVVDYDLRYRKTLERDGKEVMGFYHSADLGAQNIWLDGVGHMATAYYSIGEEARGNFFSNQMDAFLIDRNIRGKQTRSLPYTANKSGGYGWVDPKKGFISVAAWYIFAKNKFNPMTFEFTDSF